MQALKISFILNLNTDVFYCGLSKASVALDLDHALEERVQNTVPANFDGHEIYPHGVVCFGLLFAL